MTPDAVVFDFDGVLANSEPLHFGVYQRLLAEEGLTFTSDEYYSRYLGYDDVGVFEALARDKGLLIGNGRLAALIDRKSALFQSIVRTTPVLYPGARDCVLAVRDACPIAIASGALRHEIEMILAGGGLEDIVPVIVAAGETPRGKPAPDPFARAVELLSERQGRPLSPVRSVGIEDSKWGLQSARDAGLRTIGLTTSYPASQLEADLILPDVSHVTVDRLEALVADAAPESDSPDMREGLVDDFLREVNSPDDSSVGAALTLAQVAYPRLVPAQWVGELDAMGARARQHLEVGLGGHPPRRTRLRVISEFFFGQLGFTGNREHYEDPRNSFLNDVIVRRTGIPISLAVVFIEVARRAGLTVEGVNFPGHFLMRCPAEPREPGDVETLIVDPFHGGAVLSEDDCLRLLRTHTGAEKLLEPGMLESARKRAIVLRMLLNLKRSFVRMRSFQQARDIAELLVALDPSALTELRDRGLLASHLRDYASALGDLESWLQRMDAQDEAGRGEVKEVSDHVKALRRRLASLN